MSYFSALSGEYLPQTSWYWTENFTIAYTTAAAYLQISRDSNVPSAKPIFEGRRALKCDGVNKLIQTSGIITDEKC